MKVALLGGTGSFGRALAVRLRGAGVEVVIGSRDAERARDKGRELGVEGAANEDALAGADLAVLAVKADAALETATLLAGVIGATPLLTVASELSFTGRGVLPSPEARSLAERVAEVVPGPVVAGLHSLAAATLAGDEPPEEDAFVCGDDTAAKELALDLASRLVGGRALDAGPLASARALEGMTGVIVNLNKRYKGHAGLRVTGLP
jgi:8-hydroxy-5-deazaflavin:NADPH oxidoreductase